MGGLRVCVVKSPTLSNLRAENARLRAEVERMNKRIETARLKEIKLLSDLIEMQKRQEQRSKNN